jgi:hypothetical protein
VQTARDQPETRLFFLRAEASRRRSLWKHCGIDPIDPTIDRPSFRLPITWPEAPDLLSSGAIIASRIETTNFYVNYAALWDSPAATQMDVISRRAGQNALIDPISIRSQRRALSRLGNWFTSYSRTLKEDSCSRYCDGVDGAIGLELEVVYRKRLAEDKKRRSEAGTSIDKSGGGVGPSHLVALIMSMSPIAIKDPVRIEAAKVGVRETEKRTERGRGRATCIEKYRKISLIFHVFKSSAMIYIS